MLYIYSKNNITEIVCLKTTYKAQKPSLSVVKSLCERELFSYESRIKYTKSYLNIKTKIPVYINQKLLLMPINSPKRYDTFWLNYFQIFSFSKLFDKTIVLFNNLVEITIEISYKSFTKIIERAQLVEQYYEDRLTCLTL